MNWQSVSFDWNLARAFLATVEEGSLSAAARALGLTQPTLGRQVAGLEQQLEVTLFERVGKSLVLTPSGLELLEHVRAMYEAANHMSLAASGQSQAVDGLVRITASDVMSTYILPEVLKRIREQAPLIEIDVISDNNIQDLQLREADIAIRHVRPEQPDLIAKLIGDARAYFYATKAYLDAHGRPNSLDEFADHEFIGYGDNARMIEYMKPLGISLNLKNFVVGSANGVAAWHMALNDLGIAVMSDLVAQNAPNIERVLPDMAPIQFPIWLTAHRELHTSRRIRLVFDILSEFLERKICKKECS